MLISAFVLHSDNILSEQCLDIDIGNLYLKSVFVQHETLAELLFKPK